MLKGELRICSCVVPIGDQLIVRVVPSNVEESRNEKSSDLYFLVIEPPPQEYAPVIYVDSLMIIPGRSIVRIPFVNLNAANRALQK